MGCLSLGFLPGTSYGLEIIAHKGQVSETIDKTYLQAIFSGRVKMWNDGTPIKVIVYPKHSSTHLRFCRDFLKVHPRQFGRLWDIVVFSGSGERPAVASSAEAMVEKIKNTPGSIGYFEGTLSKEEINVIPIQ